MKNIKYIIFTVFFCCLFLIAPADSARNVKVYFFWGEGCPHCAKEKELLEYYAHKYPYMELLDFELYGNYNNGQTLSKVAEILNTRIDGIPFTVVGDKSFSGYSDITTPEQISERLEYCYKNTCPDSLAALFSNQANASSANDTVKAATEPKKADALEPMDGIFRATAEDRDIMHVPGLGEVDVANFSLPLISIVMGVLDGFNPCALWALLFLIGLLLGMENRKRMWALGSAFIVASASVYFLFMAAWLNFILFIGFIIWIRLLIGGVALFGGLFNVKDFLLNTYSGCKVTGGEKRQQVFARLKEIIQQKSFLLSLLGIIVLAFAVNLVELVCSAGLPAVFTQILALNDLSGWQYYSYILLYIFFFMIDDLFIFFAAMATLRVTGISTKYSRFSKLIGGVVMIIIGVLLLFKPEWLMFG